MRHYKIAGGEKVQCWWEAEACGINDLMWTCGYPINDKTTMSVHMRGLKEFILARTRPEPWWIGVAEQAWAIREGLA